MIRIHPEHLRKKQNELVSVAQPQCQDQNRDQPHKKGAKFKYLPLRDIDDICLLNILVTFAEPVILIEDSWI